MILLDARAYSIIFKAIRKNEENNEKKRVYDQLNDTVRLLEIDDGKNKQYTDDLTERMSTLKNNIQLKIDSEEIESTRKYMAKKNLEAETPTKAFCNQVKNSNCKPKPKAIC